MEDNFDNVPQEQETQQNSQVYEQQSNDQVYGQQQNQQNAGYQYSYGNNQNQQYNYDYNNGSNYEVQEDTSVMSMGDWLLTVLALLIPCAGIILYFVWAFGKNGNVNRRNYCRAYLIYWAITTVLGIILGVIFVGFMASTGGYYYY